MARESTGQVLERKGKHGTAYAARVRAYGERHCLTLGHAQDGYTRRQAETELQNILADIRRGTWAPQQPEPIAAPAQDPPFHEFAGASPATCCRSSKTTASHRSQSPRSTATSTPRSANANRARTAALCLTAR